MVKGSEVAIVVDCFSVSVSFGWEVVDEREKWLVKVSDVKDISLKEGVWEGLVTVLLVIILEVLNVVGK